MFAYGIFKVIYSPFKAFKEIIQNPKYIGPILIVILFIVANAGFAYVLASKIYDEQTLPIASQRDEWTEDRTLWSSNTPNITESDDCIRGYYYGDKSIKFSVSNDSKIWMQLNITNPLNCSGSDGYKRMSIRIKWICPDDEPNNVTLYLFSPTFLDYFYYDLTENFTSFYNNVWNNLTIPLGSKEWLNNSANARWDNINGVKLEFTWLNDSDITILIDGLFFRSSIFKSLVENATSHMLNSSLMAFMRFTIKWVLLSGILYIMSKAFGAKTVWRPLLILVGFALITLFVQTVLINIVAFATFPNIHSPFEIGGPIQEEPTKNAISKIREETWLFDQITGYVQIAVSIWTIALCAIVLRLSAEFSWSKSFLVATVAYFAGVLVEGFIL